MQRSIEEPAQGRRVQTESSPVAGDVHIQAAEQALPFLPLQVEMRQRNTEAGVPDAIHEAERRPREESIGTMVLDDHGLTSNVAGVREQRFGVRGMVENICKEDDVERLRRKRESRPIELRHRNARIWSGDDVDSAKLDVRPAVQDRFGQLAIPASDVQHRCVGGKQRTNGGGQRSDPPRLHVLLVQSLGQAHRRCIPRMLMKKLDNTV